MFSNLAQELFNEHSPGNRFSYYPLTSAWSSTKDFSSLKKEGKENLLPHFSPPLEEKNFDLYIHLPFCREICTYCGCNIKISTEPEEHLRYIQAIKREFELKTRNWPSSSPIHRLTLGGGSPNILAPKAKEALMEWLSPLIAQEELSGHMEIDPRSFTREDHDFARELKIGHFTFGVEDFNREILLNVNRKQRPEDILRAREILREDDKFGIDLLWGLPLQTPQSISHWIIQLKELSPDWISFYPLAKVPWLESIQQAYGDFTLPSSLQKYQLYEKGVNIFEELGFLNQGMGHFIRRKGKYFQAYLKKKIFRKVSGLYTSPISHSLGLGVSAISESSHQLGQNDKIIDRYIFTTMKKETPPWIKFHQKTKNEIRMNKLIENIFTGHLLPQEYLHLFSQRQRELWFLKSDSSTDHEVQLSPLGLHFQKNIMQTLLN